MFLHASSLRYKVSTSCLNEKTTTPGMRIVIASKKACANQTRYRYKSIVLDSLVNSYITIIAIPRLSTPRLCRVIKHKQRITKKQAKTPSNTYTNVPEQSSS